MWPTRQQTPKQLAGVAVCGVAFSMSAFLLAVLVRREMDLGPNSGTAHLALAGALMLAVVIPMIVFGWRAIALLREGIQIGRWREEEIEELRRKVGHPIWTAAIVLAFALGVLGLLFTEWHQIFFRAWVFLWIPVSLIIWLRHSLPKPPTSRKIFQ
jgi:L-asparagine transporter-like permease